MQSPITLVKKKTRRKCFGWKCNQTEQRRGTCEKYGIPLTNIAIKQSSGAAPVKSVEFLLTNDRVGRRNPQLYFCCSGLYRQRANQTDGHVEQRQVHDMLPIDVRLLSDRCSIDARFAIDFRQVFNRSGDMFDKFRLNSNPHAKQQRFSNYCLWNVSIDGVRRRHPDQWKLMSSGP